MSASPEVSAADAAALMDDLTALVARASALIRAIAAKGLTPRLKRDHSPVTAADEASEALILEGLAGLLPNVPVIAEEMSARSIPPTLGRSFLVVDPLDGTKEFVAGSDHFTVNVGIVTGGVPVAGVIAAPNLGLVWRGVVGGKAERLRLTDGGADHAEPIRTRAFPARDAVAVMSRSHLDPDTEAFLNRLEPIARQPAGSALKFCRIAEGAADVYPRLATVCEWDVAAGQALLAAAGGIVTDATGRPLAYGRVAEHFRVPAFIAWGDPAKAKAVISESVRG